MNIDVPAMWYLYMLAIVVSLVLLAAKKDMFSIIPTAISGIIFIVSFVGMNFRGYESRKLYNLSFIDRFYYQTDMKVLHIQ